jgi:hypothetical protein
MARPAPGATVGVAEVATVMPNILSVIVSRSIHCNTSITDHKLRPVSTSTYTRADAISKSILLAIDGHHERAAGCIQESFGTSHWGRR